MSILIYFKNNNTQPATLIKAPRIWKGVIRSLNIIADGTMINIGTNPISVAATPASVC